MTSFDARVVALYRTRKADLAALYRTLSPDMIWSAAQPEKWGKDELVNEILRIEFPNG
jgi:hypothetical protein